MREFARGNWKGALCLLRNWDSASEAFALFSCVSSCVQTWCLIMSLLLKFNIWLRQTLSCSFLPRQQLICFELEQRIQKWITLNFFFWGWNRTILINQHLTAFSALLVATTAFNISRGTGVLFGVGFTVGFTGLKEILSCAPQNWFWKRGPSHMIIQVKGKRHS